MKSLSRRAFLASAGSMWLLPRAASAADAALDDLLARIARARSPVRTIKGPFTQTRTIGLLTSEVRSRGSLSLVRPDRLRWQLAPPDDVTFWIGPEGLAYRDAHGQGRLAAGTTRTADALQDLRALLGGDLSKLEERWILRVVSDDTNGAELEATARTPPPEGTRSMRLALARDLVRPTRALLVEGARDRTAIEFGELTVNAPIDERAMRLP